MGDFKAKLSEYGAEVEAELARAMELPGVPALLQKAMRYSLEAGGKRIRPCLALGCSDMLGGDRAMALRLGCALEMIHTYSLIHDDLPCIDNDDLRRGRPSNHRVFGEGQAVFAGDALLTYAFEYLLSGDAPFSGEYYRRACFEIAKRAGASGMVAGQSLDLEAEQNRILDEERLGEIHFHKTADMLIAAVLSGAYSAAAGEEAIKRLESYASAIGLLFQITDDILDHEGDEALMGKTLGKDLESNKLTYVTLYGIDRAKELAEQTAEKASEALSLFGRDLTGEREQAGFGFLCEMIRFIKDRKN
ncbi:MAG: polyprenyl synthetase family protein [Clostridia bacterium]|nr:polyprenyl synthetase family protein [Clostridia bacterium]